MSQTKKALALILLISITLSLASLTIFADAFETTHEEYILASDHDDESKAEDTDTLLWAYLEKDIYPSTSAFGRSAYDLLNDSEKGFYTLLKEQISEVAKGERTSTEFTVSSSSYPQLFSAFSWTRSELGTITDEVVAQRILGVLHTGDLMRALLADTPCELFWFDKTPSAGMTTSYNLSTTLSKVSVTQFTFFFSVAQEFRSADKYTADINKISAINTAKSNAASIVSRYANSSDFDKLVAYKDEICGLVDYYSGDLNVAYGNPWQLVWVFDNDPQTDVVCEGYAKAFKYLCDLTEFSAAPNVYCYTVTGNMSSSTSSGDHMWNVVEIGGKNYLVDLTNSDDDSIGDDGSLFMVGSLSHNNGQTNIVGQITYTYDTENLANYQEDGVFIPISSTSYSQNIQSAYTLTVNNGSGSGSYVSGSTVNIDANVAPQNQSFERWEIIQGNITLENPYNETTSFIMPTGNVTITAIYHTHLFSEILYMDQNNHWYECECSERTQVSSHIYTKEILEQPTCSKNGKISYTCNCGYTYMDIIEKTEHTYDEGIITKPATEEENGLKKFTCTVCGHYYTKTISTSSTDSLSDSPQNDSADKKDTGMYLEPNIDNGCSLSLSSSSLTAILCIGLAMPLIKKKKDKKTR